MASTKLFLDCRSKAKDGRGSIIIILSHNKTTTSFSTGIRLLPEEWKDGKVVNTPNAKTLNLALASKKSEIDRAVLMVSMDAGFSSLTAPQIKEKISKPKVTGTKKHPIADIFREYMATDMKEGTRIIYRTALNKVISFSGSNTNIEDIDLKWLYGFDSFLSQNQCANGRAIYLRDLKTIWNYARHAKIISGDLCPFENFTIKYEPTRKKNILVDKLRKLYDFPVEPRVQEYKDMFFLMFYLIGINAADLFNAKKTDVVKGRLEYIRAKTHKPYSIKVEPEAAEIIKKYEGTTYLLNVMERYKRYSSYLRMMNDSLKLIGEETLEEIPSDNLFSEPKLVRKITPIVEDISSYYSRHTWATLAQEAGISVDTISRGLGHSNLNKTTLIYINFDRTEVDRANRRVIDYFLGIKDQ